jgi:hypothetical protein
MLSDSQELKLAYYFVAYIANTQEFYKKFPSSLMMRPNKLEGLSLESLYGQVLDNEGKARANPIETPFRSFLLG